MLDLGTGQVADLAVPLDRDELIAYGPALSDNGATRLGKAALVRRPDPDTARAIPTPDRNADSGCTTGRVLRMYGTPGPYAPRTCNASGSRSPPPISTLIIEVCSLPVRYCAYRTGQQPDPKQPGVVRTVRVTPVSPAGPRRPQRLPRLRHQDRRDGRTSLHHLWPTDEMRCLLKRSRRRVSTPRRGMEIPGEPLYAGVVGSGGHGRFLDCEPAGGEDVERGEEDAKGAGTPRSKRPPIRLGEILAARLLDGSEQLARFGVGGLPERQPVAVSGGRTPVASLLVD